MKRKLFYALGFLFLVGASNSCDSIKNCKVCSQNTYDSSNNLITEGSQTEYCDADLLSIEAKKDETVQGITSKWVCK